MGSTCQPPFLLFSSLTSLVLLPLAICTPPAESGTPTDGACPFCHGSRSGALLAFGAAPRAPSLAHSGAQLHEVAPPALERVLLAPSLGLDTLPRAHLGLQQLVWPTRPTSSLIVHSSLGVGRISDLRAYSQNIS
jgi:hypothetical protein